MEDSVATPRSSPGPYPRGGVWDVVVVGAGPAGAMAALHLAGGGARVLLLDRRDFPRDKTCGDALLPDAVRCLERAGIWETVRARSAEYRSARIVSPSGVELRIDGDFATIRREILDAVVVDAAVASGAVFRKAHVTGVELPTDGPALLRLDRMSAPERATLVIMATGADVSLLRPLGMVRRPGPSAVAVRRYLASPLPLEELIFSFERACLPGYGWIFPLGQGTFNMGVGLFGQTSSAQANPRQLFDRFVREFTSARELVGSGEFIGSLHGALIRSGLSGVEPVRGPVLAVGETVGTTFPFTGEGIGKAMESGEMAAVAVIAALSDQGSNGLEGYARSLDRMRQRYRGYRIAERWLSRPWLADLLARRAQRSVHIRRAVAGVVAETEDPRAVFSVGGLIRSAWR
jgi:menaquinone-9 beta-reductase